jgi:penicillin-binding protein 1A
MKAAHQGVPVAAIPNSQGNWGAANLMQITSQITAPSVPSAPMQIQPQMQAPQPVPVPSAGYYRQPPPTPTRASPPPNPNARPEAAAGLDGWLADRLFR